MLQASRSMMGESIGACNRSRRGSYQIASSWPGRTMACARRSRRGFCPAGCSHTPPLVMQSLMRDLERPVAWARMSVTTPAAKTGMRRWKRSMPRPVVERWAAVQWYARSTTMRRFAARQGWVDLAGRAFLGCSRGILDLQRPRLPGHGFPQDSTASAITVWASRT